MRLLLSVTTQQLILYSLNYSSSGSKSRGDSETTLQECTDSTGSACPALRCRSLPSRPTGRGDVELGEAATGGDAPNVANIEFCKPEVAIRPGSDPLWQATGHGDGELGDSTGRCDTPDLVPGPLGEPQIAVRPGSDPL